MKTTGQSEKVRKATAQEEHHSEEEQAASSSEEKEERETAEEMEGDTASTVDSSASETAQDETSEAAATPRRKRKKKAQAEPVDEQSISPRPSYWPIVLAFSLCVMFLGVAWHPIMLAVGVVMVATSLISWALERR